MAKKPTKTEIAALVRRACHYNLGGQRATARVTFRMAAEKMDELGVDEFKLRGYWYNAAQIRARSEENI